MITFDGMTYQQIKDFAIRKSVPLQWLHNEYYYLLIAISDSVCLKSILVIDNESEDCHDFEENKDESAKIA